ncbi:MAG: 4Fe-4S dicluster domain-containing protein [bacterium]
MHRIYYIETARLEDFLNQLQKDLSVFVPQAKENTPPKETEYSYQKFIYPQVLTFNPYRVVEPLKSFFTWPQDLVGGYFTEDKKITQVKKAVIVGVKSCDLAGHKIQDFVFMEGQEVDSLYRLRRENTVIISSDCTAFKKVCFCLALDILPYPSEGFDLNLSPLNEGYLVEVGSAKGQDLLKAYQQYFIPAKDTQIAGRSIKRDNLIERLQKHLLPQNIPVKDSLQGLVKQGYGLSTWSEFMLTCVECGGCNLVCDTCHCFLLSDRRKGNQNEKVRLWDSCLYANYARVAGGANPLKTRTQRLRNRFMKKFDFFIDNLGLPACCGCGRCIEVCPGKIDIREVLKDLDKKLHAKL